jgi:DNA (cytosine-5)-methyltransferase 1
MRHASTFTGIGGFDLAAEMNGWVNVFQVERDPWCNKVLTKNFPNVKRYGDIKQFDGRPYFGTIDVLSGGFPCQPFSHSGKREGTDDDRYLWPEMLRVIREIKPKYVLGENVYGLIDWSDGLVFEQIQIDLENEGYEVQAIILPACGIEAPHRRYRVWFIAYSCSFVRPLPVFEWRQIKTSNFNFDRTCEGGITANAHSKRIQGWTSSRNIETQGEKSNEQPGRFSGIQLLARIPYSIPCTWKR